VDPKGDWWGLRYGADGKSPGLPFVVLGGQHGDIPLESGTGPQAIEKNGELIARLAAIERVSMVIDLSQFRKHEVARFMTFFMETLYRLKAKDEYRTPMMLAIDEADAIAPQRIVKTGEKDLGPRMLGAAEDIVRRGGQRGIGVTLITQRAAVLNKNVLTQCGVLFALRTVAAQDIGAIDDWVQEVHADRRQRDTCIQSLPGLQQGEGWIWSTSFPAPDGIFQRQRFLMPETFDSSATPKVGQTRVVPKNAADVDLKAFEREMATAIEKAKADDPKELRRRISELEGQLRKGSNSGDTQTAEKWKREAGEWKGKAEQATAAFKGLEKYALGLVNAIEKIRDQAAAAAKTSTQVTVPVKEVRQALDKMSAQLPSEWVARKVAETSREPGFSRGLRPPSRQDDGSMSKMQRSMLSALAQHPEGLTKAQVLLHTGYASSGSTSDTFARLNENGWTTTMANFVTITDAGLAALGDYEPLPQGDALRDYLLHGNKLSTMEKRILQVICGRYPDTVAKGALLEMAGYKSSGSTSDAFARLTRYGYVVSAGANQLKASEVLFG
jgi:hypothetical protein